MLKFTAVCLTCLLLPLVTQGLASMDQDDKTQAVELLNLSEKIQKVLPAGWQIEIPSRWSTDPRIAIAGDYPAIVIRSKEKLDVAVSVAGANPADLKANPASLSKKAIVNIRLLCRPFVSQERFQALRAQNKEITKARQEFVARNLSEVSFAHKGPRPFPPTAYSPKSEEEKIAVLQYKFMWMNNKINGLPTHHFKSLSFYKDWDWFVRLRDENKQQAYQKLLGDLDSILTPYDQ